MIDNDYNAVYIGKFQPFHNAHLETVKFALSCVRGGQAQGKLLILITSHYEDEGYPFSFTEIQNSIINSLTHDKLHFIKFDYIVNKSTDKEWCYQVIDTVDQHFHSDSIILVGNPKDTTSYYLNMFPYWDVKTTDFHSSPHGTDIRKIFFSSTRGVPDWNLIDQMVPIGTSDMLLEFYETNYEKWLKFVDVYRNKK